MSREDVCQLIIQRADAGAQKITALSRRLGKNHGYLSQFLNQGTPVELPEKLREDLGPLLGVSPDDLRNEPPSRAPRGAAEAKANFAKNLAYGLELRRLSLTELADRVDVPLRALQAMMAKGPPPGPSDELLRIARGFEMTADELLLPHGEFVILAADLLRPARPGLAYEGPGFLRHGEGEGRPAFQHQLGPLPQLPKDLPLRSLVRRRPGGYALTALSGQLLRRPPALEGLAEAFAVYAPGADLEPRYREGEVLYLHPAKPPVPGCDVVVLVQGEAGPEALVRRYRRRGQDLLFLDPLDGRAEGAGEEVPLEEVLQVLRILTDQELLEG